MTVEWVRGARIRANARTAFKELNAIRNADGTVDPDKVVQLARRTSSTLHNEFEWDLKKAAQQNWHDRACYIVRSLLQDGQPAFVRVVRVEALVAKNDEPVTQRRVTMYIAPKRVTDEEERHLVLLEEIRGLEGHERRLRALERIWGTKVTRAAEHVGRAVKVLKK